METVINALTATKYPCLARSVVVEVREDVIVFSGRLHTYYLKQVAQTAAMNAVANLGLRNEILVG